MKDWKEPSKKKKKKKVNCSSENVQTPNIKSQCHSGILPRLLTLGFTGYKAQEMLFCRAPPMRNLEAS